MELIQYIYYRIKKSYLKTEGTTDYLAALSIGYSWGFLSYFIVLAISKFVCSIMKVQNFFESDDGTLILIIVLFVSYSLVVKKISIPIDELEGKFGYKQENRIRWRLDGLLIVFGYAVAILLFFYYILG